MRSELFFSVSFDRHALLASWQTGLCMLSFPTASLEEWEEVVKLGFDNGAYHNHGIKSYHCFPGATTLRCRGTLVGLLGSNGN